MDGWMDEYGVTKLGFDVSRINIGGRTAGYLRAAWGTFRLVFFYPFQDPGIAPSTVQLRQILAAVV